MRKSDSPRVHGEYWLDKRRDKKSPNWQITHYPPGKSSPVYRSTHTSSVEDAIVEFDAWYAKLQAKGRQEPQEARVLPLMMTYWDEHGRNAIKPAQIASSIRQFIGFLMIDEATPEAVVTDLTPALFERFRRWRMKPHSYRVPWAGEYFEHTSAGVRGESVQRNINDIRASVMYAEANGRLPMVPKIENLKKRYRSPARDRPLSYQQLGQIYWYCRHFPEQFRYFALMLGTAARPEAVAKFDAARQFDAKANLIDTQHPDAPMTDKRNQFIPAIRPLRPILKAWAAEGAKPAKSRKTAWRTMRRALGLPKDCVAKDIRHTVATELYSDAAVPERQLSELLGHAGAMARTTRVYAKYRPDRMQEASRALTKIWLRVAREARAFSSVHCLTKVGRAGQIEVARKGEKCEDLCGF